MTNAREIFSRTRSIQDIWKITNVMYLISSTKPRKNKKLLEETEPCFYSLQDLMCCILRHMSDVEHFHFNLGEETKEEDGVKGLIVITGDKRLAGVYSHNVLKVVQEWMEQGKSYRLYVVGELECHYFETRHVQVEEQLHYTVQSPTMYRARLVSSTILEDYKEGCLDEVWIIYTQMFSSAQMGAEMTALLPLKREDLNSIVIPANTIRKEIQMVSSPNVIMDHVAPNHVTGFILGALVESFCSKQNARMMAMQSASDNANTILNDLSVEYNRVRQAVVTQETTEIVSGAKAQKKKRS